MTCLKPSNRANNSLRLLICLAGLCGMSACSLESNDDDSLLSTGGPALLANGRVDPAEAGPANYSAATYQSEIAALCNPAPCVKPEEETNPVYQLKEWEVDEIAAYRAEQNARITAEPPAPIDPADPSTYSSDIKAEPILDTLKFQARLYTEGFDDLAPYAYTRLLLIDVQDAPKAALTYRRYEIKKKLKAALMRIAQLEALLEVKKTARLIDPVWLESELTAVYQIRRSMLAELRNREIWAARNDPAALVEGGTP